MGSTSSAALTACSMGWTTWMRGATSTGCAWRRGCPSWSRAPQGIWDRYAYMSVNVCILCVGRWGGWLGWGQQQEEWALVGGPHCRSQAPVNCQSTPSGMPDRSPCLPACPPACLPARLPARPPACPRRSACT